MEKYNHFSHIATRYESYVYKFPKRLAMNPNQARSSILRCYFKLSSEYSDILARQLCGVSHWLFYSVP